MQFQVPQFIEHESKLIGPLTIRQALFIVIPSGAAFVIYLAIGKTNYLLFLSSAILLIGGGVAFAFIKIQGRPLSHVLINFLKHITKPQRYFWQKTEKAVMTFEIKQYEFEKPEDFSRQLRGVSRIRRARTQVETQTR